jgi:hypothetical protein
MMASNWLMGGAVNCERLKAKSELQENGRHSNPGKKVSLTDLV